MPNYPEIPDRLLEIDELIISEHWHIDLDDDCYFMWERISGASYLESATNQLIANLQIPMCQRDNYWRFRYKGHAVQYSAQALSALIPGEWRDNGTFVPIPPSKIKEDPDHDPRVLSVLRAVHPPLTDVRELVLQRENTEPKAKNVSPHERAENYEINEDETEPEPEHLIIFDDVGGHGGGGGHRRHTSATMIHGRFADHDVAKIKMGIAMVMIVVVVIVMKKDQRMKNADPKN